MATKTNIARTIQKLIILFGLLLFISVTTKAGIQERRVSVFKKLQVSGAFKVILTQGNTEKLMIEADGNVMEKVITEVKNGILIIRAGRGLFNLKTGSITINLTFVNLDELELSGAVDIKGINAMKLNKLEIEQVEAQKLGLTFQQTA
ncbi:MAG: DUF2807 domain-containing protein [Lentimicrobium sp.]|nr:DUF2807 domain-containing protein [Lentimicrobium sp.]